MNLKENIKKCKEKNPDWGYKKIANHLKCSPNTVKYHLDPIAKLNSFERTKKHRQNLDGILKQKKDNFQCIMGYRYTKNGKIGGRNRSPSLFSQEQLKQKLLLNPTCYLTGEKINLLDKRSYELDHIHPVSKGGDNSLENCGLTLKQVNRCKSDLTKEELIDLCKKILIFNGYIVNPAVDCDPASHSD